MALFNYSAKEITLKVVYYGPGMSGKTTNLQQLHSILPPETRGRLISLATEGDRTLFFDFLPVDMGKINDFNIRFQLYTVPGQVKYSATRRLVLKGADAVVFIADSQRQLKEQNIGSLQDMRENLKANNIDPYDIPVVFQYNKRDLGDIMGTDELNADLNTYNAPFFDAVAVESRGVRETFDEITNILMRHIVKKYKVDIEAKVDTVLPSKVPAGRYVQAIELHGHEMPPPPPIRPSYHSSTSVVEKTVAVPSVTSDLPGIEKAISELRDVMSEIKDILRNMQKNQKETLREFSEFRRAFSEEKKEGIKRFFR